MAMPTNRITLVLSVFAGAVIAFFIYKAFTKPQGVASGKDMKAVPQAAAENSKASGKKLGMFERAPVADADKPNEVLSTLVARQNETDRKMAEVLAQNQSILREREKLGAGLSEEAIAARVDKRLAGVPNGQAAGKVALPGFAPSSELGQALASGADQVGRSIDTLGTVVGSARSQNGQKIDPLQSPPAEQAAGYSVVYPMGYAPDKNTGGVQVAKAALANFAPDAAKASPAAKESVPYFTIPENGTLTRVTAMTSLVGRIPIDGRVQDPMKFKAIVGRENLAANGFEVPDDVSGIVVSGVAIGDMALSCSEGYIHSLTFVFDDGSIRTVSNHGAGANANTSASPRERALGYISDLYGNPCVAGEFVTNAPRHLADIVLTRGASIGAKAYAAAQTSTTDSSLRGNSTSSVTGNRGAFVLGQMASGGVDEVTNWLTHRLKNSFDAVVTPAGQKIVLHIEKEIQIDKPHNARRLDHSALAKHTQGERHGLD
jgi:integrating conjugative element protein (TIGR03752 family)